MREELVVKALDNEGKVVRTVETNMTFLDGWVRAFIGQGYKVLIEK